MPRTKITNFSESLDELEGVDSSNAGEAPTSLVLDIIEARKIPLNMLRPDQIGQLVMQLDGLPYILDLVFPRLEADPLYDGGYYPGDILSALIRAGAHIWIDRPEYHMRLEELFTRALREPYDVKLAFLESLGIDGVDQPN